MLNASVVNVFGTVCMVSRWNSDSCLVSKSSSGLGSGMVFFVSSSSLVSSLSYSFSFNVASVSSMSYSNRPSSASNVVVVFGLNVGSAGYSGSFRIGGSIFLNSASVTGSSSSASLWSSDTVLKTKSVSGFSLDTSSVLSVGNLNGFMISKAVSYNRPLLSSLTPMNIPGSSSTLLLLFGASAGFADTTVRARLGSISNSRIVSGSASRFSSWTSDSSMICRSVFGERATTYLIISVTKSIGSASRMLSYEKPFIFKVSIFNIPTTGSRFVVLTGRCFGMMSRTITSSLRPNFSMSMQNLTGGTKAVSLNWISDTYIVVKSVAGFGNGIRLILTAGSQDSSASTLMMYDSPQFSKSSGVNFPATGGIAVFRGKNFALHGFTQRVSLGFSCSSLTKWVSDSFILSRAEMAISCQSLCLFQNLKLTRML
jgi:hypothetical protein